MEDQGVQSPQTLLVKNFSFLQLPGKHDDRCAFKLNSTFGMIGKATADNDCKSGREKLRDFALA